MEQLFAGRSKLEDDNFRPPCIRIARSLHSMLQGEFRPRADTADFIEWGWRELNTYADFAANIALDLGTEWEKKDEKGIGRAKSERANFRLCADGGCRKSGQASAGIAFFSYLHGERTLLLIAGQPLGMLANSFAAELLAMEWCLQRFRLL